MEMMMMETTMIDDGDDYDRDHDDDDDEDDDEDDDDDDDDGDGDGDELVLGRQHDKSAPTVLELRANRKRAGRMGRPLR
eukprot:765509-Hanusia_phi.AAC.2